MATPPLLPSPLPYKGSRPARPQQSQFPRGLQSKPIDHSSSVYKKAARKYVNFMVAMPILLVTSYLLFDRLALGNQAKTLPKLEEKQEG